jgi:hypothetical protein
VSAAISWGVLRALYDLRASSSCACATVMVLVPTSGFAGICDSFTRGAAEDGLAASLGVAVLAGASSRFDEADMAGPS